MKVLLDLLPDLVDLHIAALVHDLRGNDHDLALGDPLVHLPVKHLQQLLRDAADAEALDHDAVVILKEVLHQIRLRAGDELEHHDTLVQAFDKAHRPRIGLLRDEANDALILNRCEHRKVHTAECVIAARVGLFCPCAGNHIAVEHQHHALRRGVGGIADAVEQVLPGVGAVLADGLLRAGDDDGLVGVLDHVRQRRRGVGHRVRAVADDETVIAEIILLDRLHELDPVLRRHVRAVDIADLDRVDGKGSAVRLGEVAEQLLGLKSGCKAVLKE